MTKKSVPITAASLFLLWPWNTEDQNRIGIETFFTFAKLPTSVAPKITYFQELARVFPQGLLGSNVVDVAAVPGWFEVL